MGTVELVLDNIGPLALGLTGLVCVAVVLFTPSHPMLILDLALSLPARCSRLQPLVPPPRQVSRSLLGSDLSGKPPSPT